MCGGPAHLSDLSWFFSNIRGHGQLLDLGHVEEPPALVLCCYLTLVSFWGQVEGGRSCCLSDGPANTPSHSKTPFVLGGVARPSTEILAVRGQRATQPLVKPQSFLCSTAEDPTFGWLLGGCWEIPSVKENEVWMEITKRSQFFSALCSSAGERLWPLPFCGRCCFWKCRNRGLLLVLASTVALGNLEI